MAEEEKKGAGKKGEKEEKVKIAKPKEEGKKPAKKAKMVVKKEKEKIEAEKEKKAEKPQEGKKPVKKVKKEAKKEKEKTEMEEKEKAKIEKEKESKKEEKKEELEEEEVEGEEEEEDEAAEKEEEIEIIEEEEEYVAKIKPKLSKELKRSLKVRRDIKKKTPEFKRQEWFRYKRLGDAWRKPRGLQSKMRKHMGYRSNVVSIGYGSPVKTRNLHPSGFEEVMVYNVKDLRKINPKNQAARIGHSVGTRKRIEIEETAEEKGIRVLNPRRL